MANSRFGLVTVFIMVCVIAGSALAAPPIHAQGNECVDRYQDVVENMLTQCSDMQRGTVCISASGVQLLTVDDSSVLDGSVLALAGLSQIVSEASTDAYGIAMIEVPALEDGLTIFGVLYGDASLKNDPGEPQAPACSARSLGSINVRAEPSTDSAILGQLELDRTAPILSRLADSSWWQIAWDDASAWIFAELAPTDCDPATMLVIEPETGAVSGGIPAPDYQGGILESNLGTPVCDGLPQGGLLLQSPPGGASWRLNGMTLVLDGTVLLQAGLNDVLMVQVLGGQAALELGGINRAASAGQVVRVPLRNGEPDGVPGPALDAVSHEVETAPLVLLPDSIEMLEATLVVTDNDDGVICSLLPQQVSQLPENGIVEFVLEFERPQSVRLSAAGQGVTALQVLESPLSVSGESPLVLSAAEGDLAAGRYQVQARTTGTSPVVFGLTCDLPQISTPVVGSCADFLTSWGDVLGGQVQLNAPGGAQVSVLVQHNLPSQGSATALNVTMDGGISVGSDVFTAVGDSQIAGPLVFESPADSVYTIEWDGDPFSPASVEVICMPPAS